jgi:hypothetical protein
MQLPLAGACVLKKYNSVVIEQLPFVSCLCTHEKQQFCMSSSCPWQTHWYSRNKARTLALGRRIEAQTVQQLLEVQQCNSATVA